MSNTNNPMTEDFQPNPNYVPSREEKQRILTAMTNDISLQYLKDTDWYEIRAISGKPVPEDILQKRQEAREAITGE
jgi:hypothetical protein